MDPKSQDIFRIPARQDQTRTSPGHITLRMLTMNQIKNTNYCSTKPSTQTQMSTPENTVRHPQASTAYVTPIRKETRREAS